MNKQIVVYQCNEILWIKKKKFTNNTDNVDKYQKQYTE